MERRVWRLGYWFDGNAPTCPAAWHDELLVSRAHRAGVVPTSIVTASPRMHNPGFPVDAGVGVTDIVSHQLSSFKISLGAGEVNFGLGVTA